MKFKTEVSLLLVAISLFAGAMFFYSYQTGGDASALSLTSAFPYRGIALAFVGVGSISMVTASISYSKRSKTIIQ